MKIGAIGSSFIMDTILENMVATEGMSCHAIFSRTYDKGKALADKFHIPKVCFVCNNVILVQKCHNHIQIA